MVAASGVATFADVFTAEQTYVKNAGKARWLKALSRGFGLPDFDSNLIDGEHQSDELRTLIEEMTSDEQNALWENADSESCRPGLIGISFSGGGIRSSTFNLGIVQVLHKVGLFRCADYMSTVSGGGYLGTFISSYYTIKAKEQSSAPEFPFQHTPGERESDYMRHLRSHANYLAPEGFRSLLALPLVLARGLLINFLVLLPYLLAFSLVLSSTLEFDPDGSTFSYGGIWGTGYGILPPVFPITVGLLLGLAGLLCLYPAAQFLVSKMGTSQETRFTARARFLKSLAVVLIIILVVLAIEVQPLALSLMYDPSNLFVGSFELISTIANLLSDRLLDVLGTIVGKLSMYLIGLLGFASVWAVSLMLTLYLQAAR